MIGKETRETFVNVFQNVIAVSRGNNLARKRIWIIFHSFRSFRSFFHSQGSAPKFLEVSRFRRTRKGPQSCSGRDKRQVEEGFVRCAFLGGIRVKPEGTPDHPFSPPPRWWGSRGGPKRGTAPCQRVPTREAASRNGDGERPPRIRSHDEAPTAFRRSVFVGRSCNEDLFHERESESRFAIPLNVMKIAA